METSEVVNTGQYPDSIVGVGAERRGRAAEGIRWAMQAARIGANTLHLYTVSKATVLATIALAGSLHLLPSNGGTASNENQTSYSVTVDGWGSEDPQFASSGDVVVVGDVQSDGSETLPDTAGG